MCDQGNMKHRIRVAALITEADRIVLVQHVHPDTGEQWWVPPGGGLEPQDESIFECARREVFEETGLRIEPGGLVYLREFVDRENRARNLELFVGCLSHAGTLTMRNVKGSGPDEHYIREVRWVGKGELASMTVYPEVLKDEFWDDVAEGLAQTKCLGTQIG